MKKIFLLLSLVAVFVIAFAQKNDYTFGFDGLGVFKLGSTKTELEKLLNKKIALKHIGIDERYTETIDVTYNGIDFQLDLMGSEERNVTLEAVSTRSPLFKTAEGISIGADRSKIIDTYEKHLLIITKESITLASLDDIKSSIVFYMKDKKVVGISVEPTAHFRDRE